MSQFTGRALSGNAIISGVEELNEYLALIPEESANLLQLVLTGPRPPGIFWMHRDEIVRSSTFKTLPRKSLEHLIKVWPRKWQSRKRLADVRGGIDIYWRGLDSPPNDPGVAARIEKKIGTGTNRPLRDRYLLIPQGDMLTNGKPRRIAIGGRRKKVSVQPINSSAEPVTLQTRRVGSTRVPILQSGTLEDTVVIKTKRGLRLIQNLAAKKRGKFEELNIPGQPKVRSTRLGQRSRIIGVLKPTAKQAKPLDFFAAWDRLSAAREKRFDEMLVRIIQGRSPRRRRGAAA